jgi:hypothetical protein
VDVLEVCLSSSGREPHQGVPGVASVAERVRSETGVLVDEGDQRGEVRQVLVTSPDVGGGVHQLRRDPGRPDVILKNYLHALQFLV